jgi:hypothetical protein
MAKTLFDHLNAICVDKKADYYKTLDESDRETWSSFMIFRYLSMDDSLLPLIAEVQQYLETAPPDAVYKCLIELIPKGKRYLKYPKRTNEIKYEKWLIEMVSKYFEVSSNIAEDYLFLLSTVDGSNIEIKRIAEMYGTEQKLLKKL